MTNIPNVRLEYNGVAHSEGHSESPTEPCFSSEKDEQWAEIVDWQNNRIEQLMNTQDDAWKLIIEYGRINRKYKTEHAKLLIALKQDHEEKHNWQMRAMREFSGFPGVTIESFEEHITCGTCPVCTLIKEIEEAQDD